MKQLQLAVRKENWSRQAAWRVRWACLDRVPSLSRSMEIELFITLVSTTVLPLNSTRAVSVSEKYVLFMVLFAYQTAESHSSVWSFFRLERTEAGTSLYFSCILGLYSPSEEM